MLTFVFDLSSPDIYADLLLFYCFGTIARPVIFIWLGLGKHRQDPHSGHLTVLLRVSCFPTSPQFSHVPLQRYTEHEPIKVGFFFDVLYYHLKYHINYSALTMGNAVFSDIDEVTIEAQGPLAPVIVMSHNLRIVVDDFLIPIYN